MSEAKELRDLMGLLGPPSSRGGTQFDGFLTHDWGPDELGRDNHGRVSQVCAALKRAGYTPWFDEERMRGDINKTMADAIRKSACVIVFITKRYIDKASGNGPNGSDDNCKFEFDSALMSKHLGVDKIIAVVMEPRCKNPMVWPDGTVKGKLAPKLYIDMSSDDALRDNMPALLNEIAEKLAPDTYAELMSKVQALQRLGNLGCPEDALEKNAVGTAARS